MGYQLTDRDKAWIKYLRENPEKKGFLRLGKVDSDGNLISACCLGAKHYIECEAKGLPFDSYQLHNDIYTPHIDMIDGSKTFNLNTLANYKEHNLKSSIGDFECTMNIKGTLYSSLAQMNDHGELTWPEIADFIEKYPDKVFKNWNDGKSTT